MVLTTPMVLTYTHGIVSVLLNHTRTRETSVARMQDFFQYERYYMNQRECQGQNTFVCFFFFSFFSTPPVLQDPPGLPPQPPAWVPHPTVGRPGWASKLETVLHLL